MRQEVKLTQEFLAKRGWTYPLEDGFINFSGDEKIEIEEGIATFKAEYEWNGWRFSNCVFEIFFDKNVKIKEGDDIFEIEWENWTVEPDSDTQIVRWGEDIKELLDTNFESLISEYTIKKFYKRVMTVYNENFDRHCDNKTFESFLSLFIGRYDENTKIVDVYEQMLKQIEDFEHVIKVVADKELATLVFLSLVKNLGWEDRLWVIGNKTFFI